MATFPRYQHSFDLILISQTLFRSKYKYCHKCHSQLQLQLRNFSSSPKRRESIPFTEKLRRRIWNTDKPAGRIDPYSPTSPFREDVENLERIEEGYRNSEETEAGRRRDEGDISERPRSGGGGNIRAMRKQMPMDESAYVPAETIEGLEWLGSPRWKVRRRKVHKEKLKTMTEWGVPLPEIESQKFTWTKPEEHSSPEALSEALHRALVEVFTFLSAGQDPLNAVTSQGKNSADWTVAVRIDPSEDKSHAVLTFPSADLRDRILRVGESEVDKKSEKGDVSQAQAQSHDSPAAAPVEAAEDIPEESEEDVTQAAAAAASEEAIASPETIEAKSEIETETSNEDTSSIVEEPEDGIFADANTENQPISQITTSPPSQQQQPPIIESVPWGNDWKTISIKDPLIKFALIKRLIQITGLRIMDQHIRQCGTANDLLHGMTDMIRNKDKPKLAALLLQNKKTELAALPNVMVSERRVSKLDRDKRTGRHEIIVKELKRRGLWDLDSKKRSR